MKTIVGNVPFIEPPQWATLERSLIDLMNSAVDPVMEKYVRDDGSVMWPTTDDFASIDGLDDAYESFHNWPVFYLLGGDDRILELSHKEYDGITAQFARYDTGHGHPMVVKEYEQGYDWMHQGEGYVFFYNLCLADPHNRKNAERARRFAGLYLNEDPDAINYDADKKIILCPHNGSKGPSYRNFDKHYRHYPHSFWKKYPLPYLDVEGIDTVDDLLKPGMEAKMAETMIARMPRGDVVCNLAATSLVANAYLYGGDDKEKYKSWILEYVEAWTERARQNDGILPDNVGHSGEVGECMGGKWYGGYYGWTWPHGWGTLADAVIGAAENAMIFTGDRDYMELPRSQVDVMAANGEMVGKTLHVPECHNDDGWFQLRPLRADSMAHIWMASMSGEDMARIEKLRNHDVRDYSHISSHGSKHSGGHEAPWIAYLQGDYPDYPVDILRHNHAQVYQRLDFMRQDQQDPATYGDWYLQARNPITVEGLIQLTMGGPLFMYNGGLLMVRLRYFDAQRRRPGLPADVAALVEALEDERAVLHLVNLNPTLERELIVQGGAFGEHRFTTISCQQRRDLTAEDVGNSGGDPATYQSRVGDQLTQVSTQVDDVHFTVRLEPGSQVRLELGMERFVGDPSYRQPWE